MTSQGAAAAPQSKHHQTPHVPQRDPATVRRLAEQVVGHDERSLTGQVAPVADVGALVVEIVARISGLGPLQPCLDAPEVEEVLDRQHPPVRLTA